MLGGEDNEDIDLDFSKGMKKKKKKKITGIVLEEEKEEKDGIQLIYISRKTFPECYKINQVLKMLKTLILTSLKV